VTATPKKNPPAPTPYTVDARVRIGHVHVKVSDLERALRFYSGLLGLELTQRYGDGAVFLSAGGYHHHLALNTWESLGGSPPPPGTTGLYHTAIVYLSHSCRAGGCPAPGFGGQDSAARCGRPRRQRIHLPEGPGSKRSRAVLRQATRSVAANAQRRISDVHAPARPACIIEGSSARNRIGQRPAGLMTNSVPALDSEWPRVGTTWRLSTTSYSLLFDPQLPEQERINIRKFFDLLRHRLARSMPRLALDS